MFRTSSLSLLILGALAGCAPEAAPSPASVERAAAPAQLEPLAHAAPTAPAHAEPAARVDPAAPSAGRQAFGAPLDAARALTSLSDIAASPDRFADQVVKTDGEIARVCQSMGCWMELRSNAEAQPVRVPMAGHAFFLPKDVAGRHATIEGRVTLQELTPEARAHLAGEGALAVASSLSISATSVVID